MEELIRQKRIKDEDSLTSSFFLMLKYLSQNNIKEVLSNSIVNDSMGEILGNSDISFWPKWSAKNTNNSCYVEPDVFIRWDNIDLIIEAKYNDKQKAEQWGNEIIAYFNEYDIVKQLYLLAIDGNNNLKTEVLNIKNQKIKVLKTSWTKILSVFLTMELNIDGIEKEICKDIVSVFKYYGFFTGKTISQLNISDYSINDYSLRYFQGRKIDEY